MMKNTAMKILCRMLAALMIWMPYQIAHAGMIGTDQVVAAAVKTDRAALMNLVTRSDVASQLQAFGVDPVQARARIASMSDQEVSSLAGQIDSLPAGAVSNGGAILLIIVIAAVVWWMWGRR
jgi:hypothetical protein